MNYDDLDPFDVFMSALALALVSDLGDEVIWICCNLAETSEDFDVAVEAACWLREIMLNHVSER